MVDDDFGLGEGNDGVDEVTTVTEETVEGAEPTVGEVVEEVAVTTPAPAPVQHETPQTRFRPWTPRDPTINVIANILTELMGAVGRRADGVHWNNCPKAAPAASICPGVGHAVERYLATGSFGT